MICGITVAEILREATVINGGVDDTIWLVRSTSDKLIIIGTSDGRPYMSSVSELKKKIAETEESLFTLDNMLFDIKANNNDRNK